MIILKNSVLRARIDPTGAQLRSLQLNDSEYLWQGSEHSWKGSSPHLFPIIGMTFPGGWNYKGKTVLMDNHGFARTSDFKIVEADETSCRLQLLQTEETLKQYPFSFVLDISFSLDHQTLKVDYKVENPGSGELLFSLGAHPGFNCPLEKGSVFEDYFLEFSNNETISRRYKDQYLTGDKKVVLENEKQISLDYSLFDRGAIILSGLKSSQISLRSEKTFRSVTMDFKGFPYFGIWTMAGKKAPYICLEPWFGVDSSLGDSPDFEKKEGLLRLKEKETFSCSYSLTLT